MPPSSSNASLLFPSFASRACRSSSPFLVTFFVPFVVPFLSLAALAFALLLSGCRSARDASTASPDASNRYDTSAIEASFSARSDGARLRLSAALFHGGSLRLEGGDQLVATVAGAPVPLVPEWDGMQLRYTATVPAPTDAAQVVFSFLRPAGHVSAPASTVLLPRPIHVLKAPLALRGPTAAIVLGPQPDIHAVRLVFQGSCLFRTNDTDPSLVAAIDASGTASFDPRAVPGIGRCPITVSVRAESEAAPDPAFAPPSFLNESRVEAVQSESFAAVFGA
jgi:hypothetical protein